MSTTTETSNGSTTGEAHDEESPLLAHGSQAVEGAQKRLTMWGLVFLTYFAVSGGPYGLEDAVGTGYPFFFLVAMVTIPWFWSLPIALMTAELSTAMPHNGGFLHWVKEAFGPFASFQEAYWSFINSIFDIAIYPVQFENYLKQIVVMPTWVPYIVRFGVLGLCFGMNLVGVDVISRFSLILAVLVLTPFLIITAMGARFIQPKDWLAIPPIPLNQMNWGLFITTIIWSTGGFDNMSQVAGELRNPRKAFPRAMVITLVLMILSVIIPVMVSVSIAPDYSKWTDGYFSTVGKIVGGEWLRIVVVVGACLSNLGILNTYLCTCSEMLAAWGEPDQLNIKVLQKQSRWRTPWVSIVVSTLCIATATLLPFEFLVQMDQLFYSIGLLLEYFSLIKLRLSQPNMERPYRIPLNNVLLIIFLVIPIGLATFTVVMPIIGDKRIAIITSSVIVFGLLFNFAILGWRSKQVQSWWVPLRNRWCCRCCIEDPKLLDDDETSPTKGETPPTSVLNGTSGRRKTVDSAPRIN